jgi:hypothetical protein
VSSLIAFFEVIKALMDIRFVYDRTKSGLNEAMWAPWFGLPTMDSLLRCLAPGTFMADNNVGETFLNFPLHQSLRELCGVDLTHYFAPELGKKVTWERWSRCAMGLKSSPYNTVRMMMVAQELILGDKDKEANVFRWKCVVLNCPGSPAYNPSMPWVYKVRRGGGRVLVADVQT